MLIKFIALGQDDASFMISSLKKCIQPDRKIGIRKVLGATIYSVWKMLSRDFVWLVVLAILVAAPLAYYFSNQWLQQYDYRIEFSWWVFAITGMGFWPSRCSP